MFAFAFALAVTSFGLEIMTRRERFRLDEVAEVPEV